MTLHRTRGWNKRDIPRVSVTVRFEPEGMALIDAVRGEATRQDFIASWTLAAASDLDGFASSQTAAITTADGIIHSKRAAG